MRLKYVFNIRTLLICFFLIVSSCQRNRLTEMETKINMFLLKQEENIPFQFVLDTISSFEWDELLIAGPYTDLEDIKEYDLSKFPNTIKDHDYFMFFGFIHNKKGVKWMNLKGNKAFSGIPKGGEIRGCKVHSKTACRFVLKN
jgi:hypothetical protein